MNEKSAFYLALLITVTPLLSGCLCSYAVVEKMRSGDIDTFNPSAVYSQPTNSFALEGTRRNHFYYLEGDFGSIVGKNSNAIPFHAFLIIPKDSLAFAQLQTNSNLSPEEIKHLLIATESRLKTKPKLHSGYKKVTDLTKNDINFEIKKHHPAGALILVLPFTLIIDMVGAPYEFGYMMTHSQYW